MRREAEMVMMFHNAFGQTIGVTPAIRDGKLRASLIAEEAAETVIAILGRTAAVSVLDAAATSAYNKSTNDEPNLVDAVDGLCDLEYVCRGTDVAFGVDLEPAFSVVHIANMNKLYGATRREDGKVIKSPNWTPPDIESELRRQGWDGITHVESNKNNGKDPK
jgi:predicted HAD superfamily Cof-like phosphohydrolase